jgi:hypothetical protein
MRLAGKHMTLSQWAETPEATGGQYPTLKQDLNRQLSILKTVPPGSPEAAQAMFNISEIQKTIKIINAENRMKWRI